jgi:predicted ferric reductase
VNVNSDTNKCRLTAATLMLLFPPLVLLALGDYPRRSLLKETLSMLTLAAFFLLFGQFLLVRGARFTTEGIRFSRLLSLHKIIGYTVVSLLLAHPFMIVLPRFFEGGISPAEALTKILMTVDSPGVVLGMISWALILAIGTTSLLRARLGLDYRTWKWVHALLSVLLVVTASWHAIDLGRHTDAAVSLLVVALASAAVLMVIRQYVSDSYKPEVRGHERSA